MQVVQKSDLKKKLQENETVKNVRIVLTYFKAQYRVTKKYPRIKGLTIKFRKPCAVESIELTVEEMALFKKCLKNEK